jgi:hypothetical protein
MSALYDRRIDLTVSGLNITPSGLAANSLRVRFAIQSHSVQSPNACQIIVTNMSDADAKRLLNEYGPVSLSVGYVGGVYGQIFKGTVTQVIHGERERGTDKLTRIYCYDGDAAHNFATVSSTLAAGWSPKDALDTLVKAMVPYGIDPTPQALGVDLSQPKGLRALVLSGAVKDHLRDLGSLVNAQPSIQSGKVTLAANGASNSNGTILVDSAHGMQGQPRQTSSGIYVTTLINPQIQIYSNITVDQSAIIKAQQDSNPLSKTGATSNALLDTQGLGDGTYVILHQEYEGDTRGNPWYQYNTCIGSTTGKLSRSQADYLGPS